MAFEESAAAFHLLKKGKEKKKKVIGITWNSLLCQQTDLGIT